MSTFYRAPLTGISIPFSDNANVEENFPTHSAYALPSWVLVKPLRPQRTCSIPLLTCSPPQSEDDHFHCNHLPAECTFFLLLLSAALWLEMLRMVEGDVFMFFICLPGWAQTPYFMSRPCLLSVSGSLGLRSLPSP